MAADGAVQGLPSSNRGVRRSGSDELERAASSELRTWSGVDWLAGSVDLLQLLEQVGWSTSGQAGQGIAAMLAAYGPRRPKKGDDADKATGELVTGKKAPYVPPSWETFEIAQEAFHWLFGDSGLVLAKDAGPGTFYAYRWMVTNVFGQPAGMIELGGELTVRKGGKPSLRLELTGLGCAIWEQRANASADHAQRWCALRAKLERVGALLTRVDIAFDDFDGKRNVALAKCMYEVGEFDYRFAGELHRPKCKAFSTSHGQGDTFYVGHSTSEKQLRVYEKGRQLGDADSPWVRWELQLRSSSRKRLTLDVLDRPMDYMRGAFQCLDFVSACLERLVVTREATKATVKSVLRHAKRMYGATFHQLRVLAPGEDEFLQLFEFLAVDKPPGWAKTGRPSWGDVAGLFQAPAQQESDDDER